MFESKLTVTVEIPGLAEALEHLAAALLDGKAIAGIMAAAKERRGDAAPGPMMSYTPVPAASTPPVAPPVSPAPAAPVPPVNPAPSPMPQPQAAPPVTPPVAPAPTYTYEQVGTAGADLLRDNPGLMPTLTALMNKYGVQLITALRPEQLGPFATELRGLGAKL